MADTNPETVDNVLKTHIKKVCDDAGLGVMEQVYEILLDRDEVDEVAILALSATTVQEHYFNYVGPAIDSVEATF